MSDKLTQKKLEELILQELLENQGEPLRPIPEPSLPNLDNLQGRTPGEKDTAQIDRLKARAKAAKAAKKQRSKGNLLGPLPKNQKEVKKNLAAAVTKYETEYKHEPVPSIVFKPATDVGLPTADELTINEELTAEFTLKITDLSTEELIKNLNYTIISMKDGTRKKDMLMFFLGHHPEIDNVMIRDIALTISRQKSLKQAFGDLKNLPTDLMGVVNSCFGLFQSYFEEYDTIKNSRYNALKNAFNAAMTQVISGYFYKSYGYRPVEYENSKKLDDLNKIFDDMKDVADEDGNERDLTYDDLTIALLTDNDSMTELEEFLDDTKYSGKKSGFINALRKDLVTYAKNFFDKSWTISDFDTSKAIPEDDIGKETTYSLGHGKFGKIVQRASVLDKALKRFVNRMISGLLDTEIINDIKGLTESEFGSEYGYYLIKEDTTALDLEDLVQGFINANSDYTGALQQTGSAAQATAAASVDRMDKLGRAIKKAKRIIDRDIPDNLVLLKKSLLNKLEYIDATPATTTPHPGLKDVDTYKNLPKPGGAYGGLEGGRDDNYVGLNFGLKDIYQPTSDRTGQMERANMIFREAFPLENLSMEEKFKIIETTTNHIVGQTRDTGTINEKLCKLSIVNTLSDALNNMDASSAGFFLEAYLAQMGVGSVVGGTVLEDIRVFSPAGRGAEMSKGGGDLISSAKRYKEVGSKISQAHRNWGEVAISGKPIGYYYLYIPDDRVDIALYFIGVKFPPVNKMNRGKTWQTVSHGGSSFIVHAGTNTPKAGDHNYVPPTLTSGTDFDCYTISGQKVSGVELEADGQRPANTGATNNALNNALGLNSGDVRLRRKNYSLNWEASASQFKVCDLAFGTRGEIASNSQQYVQNISNEVGLMMKLITDLKNNIDDYMAGDDVEAGYEAVENYIDLQDAINEGFEKKEEESGREIGIAQGSTGDRFLKTDRGTFSGRGNTRVKLSDEELADQGLSESRKMLDAMIQSIINEAKKRKK